MRRQCENCNIIYDDLYRRTYCPHPKFEMHTVAMRKNEEGGYYEERECTSVDELNKFMAGKLEGRRVVHRSEDSGA